MKTKCKRLLSLLLVFVLVLGLMPSVYAATDEGTQPMTEPAVAEATTEPVGDTEPTVPETTGATEVTEPSESTEGTEATEAPTEAEEETTEPPEDSDEDWTQPPEDDGMSLEEWDQLRFADLSCELPAPIEEYFPFDPSIQYPYGEPVENFYPSEVLGENPFGIAMFASDPYAVAPLADMSAIPENMYDNAILRALEYTGYDVQWLKDNGYLYVAQYVSSNINSTNPDVLSDIGYDDYSPFLNGDETVADSSTVTGRAPDIAKFEANGLVCASFVSYFINNYLPNIEGINTSHIHEAIKATTMNGGSYSTASVWSWSTGLNNLAAKAGSGVTKYTNATTAYANLVPGDIIIFSDSDGDLTHAAIYAGTDADCTQKVTGSPFTTDNAGKMSVRLLPGTYFVQEVDESAAKPDWVFDTKVHVVTVKAGETVSVTLKNDQMGRAKLIKAMPDGGPVSGWVFDIYRKSDNAHMGTFTSSEDGSIGENQKYGYKNNCRDRNKTEG